MKKSFFLIGLISLISLVGCQKEQAVNTRLTATIENGAKTYFNISSATDNPGVVTWKADDEVWVNGYQFTATSLSNNGQTADLESYATPDAPYTAIYPYDAASTNEGDHYVTLPATQEYTGNEVHAPMYAYSEGNTLQFRNLCGMLVLNLQATGKTLQSITVTTGSESLSGTFKINETGDEPELVVWDVLDGGNTVTLDCGTDGVSINEATNFYIYLPPANYHTLEITFTATDGTVCTKAFQSGENAYAAFEVVRSQYNLLTFAGLTFIPAGAINGLFTINSYGGQVWFSQGNLQYIGSAATPYWKFADNQWEVLGTTTGQNSDETDVDRDLFGWGTSGCTSLSSVVLPEGLKAINQYAFSHCSNLQSVNIPDTMDYLGEGCFYKDSLLTSITIPFGLTQIEAFTFRECPYLTSIVIPEGVTELGNNAFFKCYSLQSISFPSTLTRVGYGCFAQDTLLTSAVLPQSLSTLDHYAFNNCQHMSTVTMPDSLTFMGRFCFNNCLALTSIVVPEGITVVDTSTFADNHALRRVHLPSTLQTIKYHGFYNTMNIDTISLACTTPPTVANRAFRNYSATLLVPCGSANAYRQHETWGRFSNIIEDCTGIEDMDDSELKIIIYVVDGRIVVKGADGETISVYDMTGRQLTTFTSHLSPLTFPTGVYMVQVGTSPARKVVVTK